MRLWILLFFVTHLLPASGQLLNSVTGDFNGDGKNETATFVVVRERYFEGGYNPVSIPGEYAIQFSTPFIPTIALGDISGGLLTKKDYNKNGKDELLFIGNSDDIPVIGRGFRCYEFAEKNMQGILTGSVPPLIDGRNCEDSLLITLEDTVYLLSQPLPIHVHDMYVLYAQKIYPEEKEKILITKESKLYPYVKNFVIDSTTFMSGVYEQTMVDSLPQYPGGEEAIKKFIGDNLIYPPMCKEMGIEGKVIISFVVNKDGSIGDVQPVNQTDEYLLREFMRVYKKMPNWQPGIKNGKPVRVKMTAWYNYRLN